MIATIAQVQRALTLQGFDPGGVDGVWGRRSIAALKLFQAARKLDVDGIVGPRVLAALEPTLQPTKGPTPTPPIVWYEEATRLMGVREGPGAENNPVILDWAKALDVAYPGDDVAWCGLFVAHCIGATLPAERMPTNPLAARAWAQFGFEARTPGVGAVLAFWRGSKSGWQGHVGFYAGEDADAFHVLGGNQGDRVSIARIARDRLISARWPNSAATIIPQQRLLTVAGKPLSTNEA